MPAVREVQMPISWNEETRELHLHNASLSYVMCVLENGALGHVWFGAPLDPTRSHREIVGRFEGFANRLGDPVPLECPTPGTGDFRVPALTVAHADGSRVLDLVHAGHRVRPRAASIPGLPSSYVEADAEADTVEVDLRDRQSGLDVTLRYTVFRDLPVVTRSARIANGGDTPVSVECAMSASLDLPDAEWDLLQLSGTWARERHVHRARLRPGAQSVSSVRGVSSHQHNPFVALARPWTDETAGDAYGIALVYSGNFLAEAEVDAYETSRVRIGINPDTFSWQLAGGEELSIPEAVLVYSAAGLGAMSDALHRLFREHLARGAWRDRPRPILVNSWEATYFDFDESRLLSIARSAADLGIELFVLDDGWFGERNDDTSSLGDWTVNRAKLPNGLDGLGRGLEEMGLRFGLWIEPEMVSPRSRLFEEHPEWAVGVPGRPRTESRNQYVLDLGRPEVVDHLFTTVSDVLASAPISYVKWDMNRNLTEPYSAALPPARQGEFFHRYVLGLYELYRRLTEAFPEILFESCSGGGGRFDPGLLAFAPQAWTSDDTDAMERLRIQWGTSLAYPPSSMGAHVSAVPNHQVGRVTSLSTRAAVAFFGVFGFELDPTALSEQERAEIARHVAFYVRWRELFQRGRFVRLMSPFEGDGNETAWMTISDDRRAAIVGHYQVLNRPAAGPRRLRLRGLDPAMLYRVSLWSDDEPASDEPSGERPAVSGDVRRGDELMAVGLRVTGGGRETPAHGDFAARLFVLEAAAER